MQELLKKKDRKRYLWQEINCEEIAGLHILMPERNCAIEILNATIRASRRLVTNVLSNTSKPAY